MRNELLSIGEVSKMKNVGVKSLRYYERLGILPPAFVDPQSGYRYYSMNQMVDIDVITTCISLGIPLKELTDYLHPHSVLDIEPLLERGRGIAVQRLRAAQAALNGWDPSGGAIYYYNPKTATNKWIRSRPVIATIGKHVFCS